ncbi:MAG: hypothetical protein LC650_03900 [Actinobacteria bacterium]|nr:hypothetical protein [Actinomycetota bacterium]
MLHTELEASQAAGYSEALFDEVQGTIEWARGKVPDGDCDAVAQVLRDAPFRTVGGDIPEDVLELARVAEHMAFRGLNFNGVDAHQVLYNVGNFWDKIEYGPKF